MTRTKPRGHPPHPSHHEVIVPLKIRPRIKLVSLLLALSPSLWCAPHAACSDAATIARTPLPQSQRHRVMSELIDTPQASSSPPPGAGIVTPVPTCRYGGTTRQGSGGSLSFSSLGSTVGNGSGGRLPCPLYLTIEGVKGARCRCVGCAAACGIGAASRRRCDCGSSGGWVGVAAITIVTSLKSCSRKRSTVGSSERDAASLSG